VQRAGSQNKARFEGSASFVFCHTETTPSEVRRRLQFFEGIRCGKMPVKTGRIEVL
jgi:hypothetical protein